MVWFLHAVSASGVQCTRHNIKSANNQSPVSHHNQSATNQPRVSHYNQSSTSQLHTFNEICEPITNNMDGICILEWFMLGIHIVTLKFPVIIMTIWLDTFIEFWIFFIIWIFKTICPFNQQDKSETHQLPFCPFTPIIDNVKIIIFDPFFHFHVCHLNTNLAQNTLGIGSVLCVICIQYPVPLGHQ